MGSTGQVGQEEAGMGRGGAGRQQGLVVKVAAPSGHTPSDPQAELSGTETEVPPEGLRSRMSCPLTRLASFRTLWLCRAAALSCNPLSIRDLMGTLGTGQRPML